jgi:hypothetical protein
LIDAEQTSTPHEVHECSLSSWRKDEEARGRRTLRLIARGPGAQFWQVLIFLMEALVFILIGLSLRSVIMRLGGIGDTLISFAPAMHRSGLIGDEMLTILERDLDLQEIAAQHGRG